MAESSLWLWFLLFFRLRLLYGEVGKKHYFQSGKLKHLPTWNFFPNYFHFNFSLLVDYQFFIEKSSALQPICFKCLKKLNLKEFLGKMLLFDWVNYWWEMLYKIENVFSRFYAIHVWKTNVYIFHFYSENHILH